jgi:ceramide glucosyltransferase
MEAIRRTLWYGRSVRRGKLPQKIGLIKPSVLVMRPCAGHEASLERALASLAKARRSFELRCSVAIESEDDTAVPAARRAIETLERAGITAQIVFTGGGGPNRKAAQLAAVANDADVIIVADSDVDLEGANLDILVAPVVSQKPAWIAWAPPIEMAEPCTWGDRASEAVLGASLHSFPILARLDPRGLVGKLFAIRKNALVAIGGFGSLVNYLGEDMEIARRIRQGGGRVVSVPLIARSLASGRSWSAIVARFARWMTVIRAQRSILFWSYPGLFFATWPIVTVSLWYSLTEPFYGFLSAGLVLTTRLFIAFFATHISGRPQRPLGILRDAFLADLMLACAFSRALRSRTVTWRDHVLVVDRAGTLRESS